MKPSECRKGIVALKNIKYLRELLGYWSSCDNNIYQYNGIITILDSIKILNARSNEYVTFYDICKKFQYAGLSTNLVTKINAAIEEHLNEELKNCIEVLRELDIEINDDGTEKLGE